MSEDIILAALRAAALAGEPCPSNAALMEEHGITSAALKRALRKVQDVGRVSIEVGRLGGGGTRRRAVFPDGQMTDWSAPPTYTVPVPPLAPSQSALEGRSFAEPLAERHGPPRPRKTPCTGLLAEV